ncbi:MAG: hypothetical protein MN733_40445 [Nitrososphaera sp.]|nr:hypothetical protein [Nitrososphaera sp.]
MSDQRAKNQPTRRLVAKVLGEKTAEGKGIYLNIGAVFAGQFGEMFVFDNELTERDLLGIFRDSQLERDKRKYIVNVYGPRESRPNRDEFVKVQKSRFSEADY